MKNIVILAGARTAVGSFGGTLAQTPPCDLGTIVAKAAIKRANIDPERIGHVAFGNVINTEPRDMYLGRISAVEAGVPETTPAMNVNRLCGSGIQAVISVAQSLMLGDADFGLAGGAESMSRAPYISTATRWGQKMGDVTAQDMLLGTLNCPFGTGHMGITAENVAKEYDITRTTQDALALESQTRAAKAIAQGLFKDQIVPVEVRQRRELVPFETDEHPKSTTSDALAGLRPAFQKDGTVTAGNASGLNDGAAAMILATEDAALAAGLKPMARIVGYAQTGVRPDIMGIGPISAVQSLLQRTGLGIDDFAVIESNEAFAAQACAVSQSLLLDPARVNPNGGAIALGHPVGATGAIILIKLIYELQRTGQRYGLATMCIGGGQGIAIAIENANVV